MEKKLFQSSFLDPNSAQTKSVDYIAMKTNQWFFSRSRFFLFFSPVLFLVFNLLYWVYFRSTNPFDHLIDKSRRTHTSLRKIKIQTPDNKIYVDILTMGIHILSFSECGSCGLTARKNFPFFNFFYSNSMLENDNNAKRTYSRGPNLGQFCMYSNTRQIILLCKKITCCGKLYCIVLYLYC